MKVLITGGAGFIGTNYVYTHMQRRPQDKLLVLDALNYAGKRSNLKKAEVQGLSFVEGRIEDKSLVMSLFKKEKFDLVVNFAAETHVDRSIEDPEIFIRSNVMGTQVLLDAALNHDVKRFHHISTDEVYGDLGFGSHDKFTEESAIKPSSPYSASKAASDMLVMAYYRTFGLPVSISRCSNNYGPYQDPEKLIPLLISRAKEGKSLKLYGSGKNVRDWLFVQDHCDAILSIIEKGQIGEIYNIGGANELENIEIASIILRFFNQSENLITYIEDRKGHDERYAIDFSKLTKETGWQPRVTFEEGMRKTIQWYKLNSYERSHSSGRKRVQTQSSYKSHKQTFTSGL